MDKRTWEYLSVLEQNDPAELSETLTELIDREQAVTLNPDDSANVDIKIPFVGGIDFDSSCSSTQKNFFKWLSKQLTRRRERKYDELTGLYSRSYWEREVKLNIDSENWALAMADIDHFKRFNDEHGHDMGDRVLEAVGDLLRNELPNTAKLIRYGGEEVLILLDLDFSDAMSRLDSLREKLASSQLFSQQPSTITMSFGLAEHEPDDEIDDTIKQADLALYESKGSGRNRLTTYAPYLDYSRQLYAWGVYRYIWSPEVRFSLGKKGLRMLLYWRGTLQWYDWNENQAVFSNIPSDCEQPFRSIRRAWKGFILLDSSGELWHHVPGSSFERYSSDSDPTIVGLAGQSDELTAVGINNQLYEVSGKGLVRSTGLPPQWDEIVISNGVYIVIENILIKWRDEQCVESWPLPESTRQITSTGSTIVMVGESSRMFKFNPYINRWEQTQFMNLVGSWVPCREVSPSEDRMLILDDHGRLLLVIYGDGTNSIKKSMPQKVDLKHPREPVEI